MQVLGNETPSTLICFASKTTNAGQITSKLHVIELGAQPGSLLSSFLFSCVHTYNVPNIPYLQFTKNLLPCTCMGIGCRREWSWDCRKGYHIGRESIKIVRVTINCSTLLSLLICMISLFSMPKGAGERL